MGSKSDEETMSVCAQILTQQAVPYEKFVHSAHREPAKIQALIKRAKRNRVVAIIAGAGLAAHLPGFIASLTDIPVLGVPLPSSTLGGLDSLLAIVQMPAGYRSRPSASGNRAPGTPPYSPRAFTAATTPDPPFAAVINAQKTCRYG